MWTPAWQKVRRAIMGGGDWSHGGVSLESQQKWHINMKIIIKNYHFWPNFDLSSNAGISCLAFAHSSTTKPGKSWAWRIRRSLQRWQRMRQINHCEKSWAGIWQPILLKIFHYTNGIFSRYFGWIWRKYWKGNGCRKKCQSLKKGSVLNPILCKLKKIISLWRCFHAYTSVYVLLYWN